MTVCKACQKAWLANRVVTADHRNSAADDEGKVLQDCWHKLLAIVSYNLLWREQTQRNQVQTKQIESSMSELQLFAIDSTGPQPLEVPAGATQFTDLYAGMALGVYSVLRTFEHDQFLHLDEHLARLRHSMRLLGWTDDLDETAIRRTLQRICPPYPAADMRVRIDVLAAPAPGTDTRLLVALMPFIPLPRQVYETGVIVDFAPGLARPNPRAKTAAFAQLRQKQVPTNTQVFEQLLVDSEGRILEGTSSNFYGIQQRTLYTAGEGVLAGITRQIVLNLAAELGLPIHFQAVAQEAIDQLTEAAISSSSRGILPVVQIGDQPIGTGAPGPICRQLMVAYDAYVARAIRPALD